jgi:hypothetical protein
LKDLIAYFREIQSSYETRGKALLKVSNVVNNTNAPSMLMTEGGLSEANRVLRDYHKQSVAEANKARDIENDVINQLSGLRADLGQKIKEIKSLSGDFKNSVEKEKDHTRKAVNGLQEALAVVDTNPHAIAGKDDPFLIRLSVERQVEKQVDEENYLHRVCTFTLHFTTASTDKSSGISQPRRIRSRTRVDRCRRNTKGVQCICWHHEERGRYSLRSH